MEEGRFFSPHSQNSIGKCKRMKKGEVSYGEIARGRAQGEVMESGLGRLLVLGSFFSKEGGGIGLLGKRKTKTKNFSHSLAPNTFAFPVASFAFLVFCYFSTPPVIMKT